MRQDAISLLGRVPALSPCRIRFLDPGQSLLAAGGAHHGAASELDERHLEMPIARVPPLHSAALAALDRHRRGAADGLEHGGRGHAGPILPELPQERCGGDDAGAGQVQEEVTIRMTTKDLLERLLMQALGSEHGLERGHQSQELATSGAHNTHPGLEARCGRRRDNPLDPGAGVAMVLEPGGQVLASGGTCGFWRGEGGKEGEGKAARKARVIP